MLSAITPVQVKESCRRAHGPTRSTAAMASAAARLLRTYAIQVSFLLRPDEVGPAEAAYKAAAAIVRLAPNA